MHYVYILRSQSRLDQTYMGSAHDLHKRIAEHNAGKSKHTAKFTPWRMIAYVAFASEPQAARFERYLKSGSGRAFAKRHLWDSDK